MSLDTINTFNTFTYYGDDNLPLQARIQETQRGLERLAEVSASAANNIYNQPFGETYQEIQQNIAAPPAVINVQDDGRYDDYSSRSRGSRSDRSETPPPARRGARTVVNSPGSPADSQSTLMQIL